jgi:hypothetical protein
MSFNKKYINFNIIESYIRNGGIESLVTLFSNQADVFIMADDISSEIYRLYLNKEFKKIECLVRV